MSTTPTLSLLALGKYGHVLSSSESQHSPAPESPQPSSRPDDAYQGPSSFYKSAQWTPDGTTIITSSYTNQISTFTVPPDLLTPRAHPLTLRPQRTLTLAEPTNILVPDPLFNLWDPLHDRLLIASRDHPLQLYPALAPAGTKPIASFNLVSPTTEAYRPVHSALWSHPGTHFLVGTRDLIAYFDASRDGAGPAALVPTIPSRRHISKGNGVGMRGTVSALAAQPAPTGLVAAGTWTRWVGLYDFARGGECTATWGIERAAAESVLPPSSWSGNEGQSVKGIGGAGITQTAWSPCGRYLVINERQSIGMLVYDVRVTGKLLGFLAGRDALTHQRLSCDVFQGLESVGGFEVWAGTRDGTVKVWEGVGNGEGCQWPSWDFSHGDSGRGAAALGSVALHRSGSVVATCSGSWSIPGDDDDDADSVDSGCSSLLSLDSTDDSVPSRKPDPRIFEQSSLRLWGIGPSASVDGGTAPTMEVPGEDTRQADASVAV